MNGLNLLLYKLFVVLALALCFKEALAAFEKYDKRQIELDKFYATQGYSQLYSESKDAVFVQAERMAW